MRPNVLFLLIDSLRADRFAGPERHSRTPFLDELRAGSTVFTNAFATASMTTVCTASILTGTYPYVHGVHALAGRRLRSDVPTLAEACKAAGYETWAEVTGPLDAVTGLDRGFDEYRLRDYTQWLDTAFGDELVERLRRARGAPWFGLVHLWELHYPRRAPWRYRRRKYGRDLYDHALSALDAQLARVLSVVPEQTVIVVTGDHAEYIADSRGGTFVAGLKRPAAWLKRHVPGVKKAKRLLMRRVFKEHRESDVYRAWLGHGFHVYDALVHVPLVFRGPGVFPPGLELPHLVSHVDIFPTLASALGLGQGVAHVSGVDLMPVIRNPSADLDGRAIYIQASGAQRMLRPETWLAAVRTERYKYARGYANPALPEELYDLERDPAERENVIAQSPEVADLMRARLREMLEGALEPHQGAETAYSPEEQAQLERRLRDLGYM